MGAIKNGYLEIIELMESAPDMDAFREAHNLLLDYVARHGDPAPKGPNDTAV